MAENTESLSDRYREALLELAKEALLLFVFAAIATAGLYYFADSGPVRAVRESLLSSHLVFQAYSDTVPETPFHVRLIAFDEQYCAARSEGDQQGCQPKGPIDRADLALFIETAARASPKAIVIDVEPLSIGACDAPTRKLVLSILAASRISPIILPRTSLWNGDILRYGPTFLDQCSEAFSAAELAEIERGEGIFFGHALLSTTHFLGVVDSVRPWVAADIPNPQHLAEVRRPGQTRVRVPQIALIGGLALHAASGAELLSTLQASGLETRWHAAVDPAMSPAPLEYCGEAEGTDCALQVGSLASPPDPVKLSFRFGNQTKMVETESERERRLIFSRLGFSRFNDSAAKDLARLPNLLFVAAATAEAYDDIHPSAAGRLPGGHILANAIFDFSDGRLIKDVDRRSALFEDLRSLLLFVAVTAAIAFVITLLLLQTRLFNKKTPTQVLSWIWPLTLIVMASWETYAAWQKLHGEFSQGEFSYAVIGCVIGLLDLRTAMEMSVKSVSARGKNSRSIGVPRNERETAATPKQATLEAETPTE